MRSIESRWLAIAGTFDGIDEPPETNSVTGLPSSSVGMLQAVASGVKPGVDSTVTVRPPMDGQRRCKDKARNAFRGR